MDQRIKLTSQPSQRHSLANAARLLLTQRYGSFWIGSLLSNLGTWMQQIAEPWLILSLGGSSILLGLDGFAMNAPAWVLTLLGGMLADSRDKRKIIFTFQSIQMLFTGILVLLILTGTIRIWMIIAVSVVVGITDALSMPAFQSMVPSIVERPQIGTAIALNSTQFNLSRVLGPAIAGLVLARFGAAWCFGGNTLSYVPLILTTYWIQPIHKPSSRFEMKSGGPWFKEIANIGRQRTLRGALLTVLVTAVFCAPLITFCPVLVRDLHHSDALHFGQAIAAFGIGGMFGATGILALEGLIDRAKLSSGFAIAYGILILGIALNPSLTALSWLLVLCGAAMTASNTSANSILQFTAHDRVRGRTASLYMLAMRGGLSVGNLVTGISISYLGIRVAFLINGILAVLIQTWIVMNWAPSDTAAPAALPNDSRDISGDT